MKRMFAPFLALCFGVLAQPTQASSTDILDLNISSPTLELTFKAPADPALRHVSLTFSASRRTAFSREAPLLLPCDVEDIHGNIIIRNISGGDVYPEIQGELFINGLESQAIQNYFGFTTSKVVLPLLAAGATTSPGYIIASPGMASYDPLDLPENTPVKLILRPRAYSNNVFDHAVGGYSQADLLPETIWNNVMSIWIQRRSCG